MTDRQELFNWLTIGFSQSPKRHSELFYFDKRDNQFFSLLVTDYFLFDDKLNLAKDTSSTYSQKSLDSLQDRVKRLESNDKSVLAIPRLGEISGEEIQKQIAQFIATNNINLDTVTIWETEDKGTITINLDD
jgi:hypothetical protein